MINPQYLFIYLFNINLVVRIVLLRLKSQRALRWTVNSITDRINPL